MRRIKLLIRDYGLRMKIPLKRCLHAVFASGQRLGINITPRHYESPIPYLRMLPEEIWDRRYEMTGVNLDAERQMELVRGLDVRYGDEFAAFPMDDTGVPGQYYINNRFYGSVDGEILYCFVRHFKPRKVVEIGGGNSTLLLVQSMLKNEEEDPGYHWDISVVDPHPRKSLKSISPGHLSFKKSRVQDVSLNELAALEAGDILFIDSSHALSIGSDVNYEILEILPRLEPGVIVHVHDIFLPAEYPRSWVVDSMRFLNEQYMLQAFLAFNREFEVLLAGSFMHLYHPQALEGAFKTYRRDETWPCSFWFRRKSDAAGS